MDTLVSDAPFMNFLAVVAVALIGAYGSIQIKKLDRKNTAQHEQGQINAQARDERLLSRLDEVHDDVIITNVRVGEIKGKLDAHIENLIAHPQRDQSRA